MTAQQTADVIANARDAVAKGNADYLERTIVALADRCDDARDILSAGGRPCRACGIGGVITGPCETSPPCWEHRRRAFLARHEGRR